jgi:hypothetical protein
MRLKPVKINHPNITEITVNQANWRPSYFRTFRDRMDNIRAIRDGIAVHIAEEHNSKRDSYYRKFQYLLFGSGIPFIAVYLILRLYTPPESFIYWHEAGAVAFVAALVGPVFIAKRYEHKNRQNMFSLWFVPFTWSDKR